MVVGGALYVTVVGLLGLGLGAILRSTAVAVSTVVGLLFVLPILSAFLPQTGGRRGEVPARARPAAGVFSSQSDPTAPGPMDRPRA